MIETTPAEASRIERVLAFMLLAVVLLSVGCFIAMMVATSTGTDAAGFTAGVWPAVLMLPMFGFPLAIVMLIALIVIGAVRRSRRNRR
ncbi:hypothetical protein GCM10027416_09440 [Okibacterium endophyticum]